MAVDLNRVTGFLWLALLLGFTALGEVQIVDVTWEADIGAIHILLDRWPKAWGGWRFFLNGVEVPMEGPPGKPVIRPDAPLAQPPTGLFVGTLPWPASLDDVDFPCCGKIQLYIPGEGYTGQYRYNLVDQGCATASPVQCPHEWIVHEGDLVVGPRETRVIEGAKFLQRGHVYICLLYTSPSPRD